MEKICRYRILEETCIFADGTQHVEFNLNPAVEGLPIGGF
jgi:hypothetical protein